MTERVFSIVGLFDSPQALLAAVPRLKLEAWHLEAYTPYPVRGLDAALEQRRSPLAGMVLVMGILGTFTAWLFQWWMNSVDYPIVVGGKDPSSWQAYVPIMFEVAVLFATFTAGLGMLFLLNKLPAFWHPFLLSRSAAKVTCDKFALAVEANDQALDVVAAESALREAGAVSVEIVYEPAPAKRASPNLLLGLAAVLAIGCSLAGYAVYWGIKLFPVLPPMSHMLVQPRADAFDSSGFFKDGRAMRSPVPGTIARGQLPYPVKTHEQAERLRNPLPRTHAVMLAGRSAYNNVCSVCHGPLADGTPTLTEAYGAKPANLQSGKFLKYSDGRIYDTIVRGMNAMPSYASPLTEHQRWAVVHYLRAVQRAQHAKDSDLP